MFVVTEATDDRTALARDVITTSTEVKRQQTLDKGNRIRLADAATAIYAEQLGCGQFHDGVDFKVPEFPKTTVKAHFERSLDDLEKVMPAETELDDLFGVYKVNLFESKTKVAFEVTDPKALFTSLVKAYQAGSGVDPFSQLQVTFIGDKDEALKHVGVKVTEKTVLQPRVDFLETMGKISGQITMKAVDWAREFVPKVFSPSIKALKLPL